MRKKTRQNAQHGARKDTGAQRYYCFTAALPSVVLLIYYCFTAALLLLYLVWRNAATATQKIPVRNAPDTMPTAYPDAHMPAERVDI